MYLCLLYKVCGAGPKFYATLIHCYAPPLLFQWVCGPHSTHAAVGKDKNMFDLQLMFISRKKDYLRLQKAHVA